MRDGIKFRCLVTAPYRIAIDIADRPNKGKPNGGLANRRHQMNYSRYQAGGDL